MVGATRAEVEIEEARTKRRVELGQGEAGRTHGAGERTSPRWCRSQSSVASHGSFLSSSRFVARLVGSLCSRVTRSCEDEWKLG